jgi:DNA-binding NarL/FixJ family response regulator
MASQHKIRVLVADNSPLHSQLLAEAVGRDRHIKVVGSTVGAACIVDTAMQCCPDVLLIGANLDEQPNRGLAVLRELQGKRSNLKAVVLLDSSTPNTIIQAFLSGARGVFYRSASFKALCKCIRVVSQGQIWANNEEVGFLLAALSAASASMRAFNQNGVSLLSKREVDVVRCLVGAGLSNREISRHLGISNHTVKNYMQRIFEKLGVSSRVELMFCMLGTRGADAICNNLVSISTGEAERTSSSESPRTENAPDVLQKVGAAVKEVSNCSRRRDREANVDRSRMKTRLGSA